MKAMNIRKALNFNRITDAVIVSSQEKVWEEIYKSREGGKGGLIITDMQYPLTPGGDIDRETGFKLIDRMKNAQIDILINIMVFPYGFAIKSLVLISGSV